MACQLERYWRAFLATYVRFGPVVRESAMLGYVGGRVRRPAD
jgi:hypothetical protein